MRKQTVFGGMEKLMAYNGTDQVSVCLFPKTDYRNFSYTYDKGRRSSENVLGRSYSYDRDGNVTNDGVNSLQIRWNLLDLPLSVSDFDGYEQRYTYLADGTKVGRSYRGTEYAYSGSLTLFKVNGDQNATSLFEFILRAGSRVEWDLVGVGTRSNGSNFIGTMNNKKITSAVPYLFYSGYTIRSSSHYHPSSKYAPSGKDSYIKSIVTKKFPNATFTIMGFDVFGNSVYVSY